MRQGTSIYHLYATATLMSPGGIATAELGSWILIMHACGPLGPDPCGINTITQ